MTIQRAMTPFEWALLVTLSLLWGGSFFFVAVALEALSPLMVVTLRVTISAPMLLAILAIMGLRLPTDGQSWRDFAMMALLNSAIPYFLIAWGQSHIASGLASILIAPTPLFTVLIAHFVTVNERASPARIIGVLIGIGGVVVTIGPAALGGMDHQFLGQLALVGAALSYASSVVFALRFPRKGLKPILTVSGQMIAASFILLPFLVLFGGPLPTSLPPVEVIAAIGGLAVLSTVVAYLIYYRLLATTGSVNLMLVTFLIPVSAILLGVLILGEALVAHQLLGMAIIGIGLAVIDGRLMKKLRS
jgi:drug/metabolite transporter (DMT)-like permease